jgi:hypothetical protein
MHSDTFHTQGLKTNPSPKYAPARLLRYAADSVAAAKRHRLRYPESRTIVEYSGSTTPQLCRDKLQP